MVSAMSWTALGKAVVKVLGSETDISGLEATEDRPLPHGLERRMLPVGFKLPKGKVKLSTSSSSRLKQEAPQFCLHQGLVCRSDN